MILIRNIAKEHPLELKSREVFPKQKKHWRAFLDQDLAWPGLASFLAYCIPLKKWHYLNICYLYVSQYSSIIGDSRWAK